MKKIIKKQNKVAQTFKQLCKMVKVIVTVAIVGTMALHIAYTKGFSDGSGNKQIAVETNTLHAMMDAPSAYETLLPPPVK